MTIKRGDRRNAIKAVLQDADGNPVNLTGCEVAFVMAGLMGGTPVVNRAAHIEDATGGEVWVVWEAGETDVAGIYQGEFKVTHADGKIETFPNDRYISIRIMDDLGGGSDGGS